MHDLNDKQGEKAAKLLSNNTRTKDYTPYRKELHADSTFQLSNNTFDYSKKLFDPYNELITKAKKGNSKQSESEIEKTTNEKQKNNPISNENEHSKSKNSNATSLYSTYIKNGSPYENLKYGDLSVDNLKGISTFKKYDFRMPEQIHIQSFRLLANLTSSENMNVVVNNMVSHFLDGTGTDYSNEELTKIVESNETTQKYMKSFSEELHNILQQTKDDFFSNNMKETLKEIIDEKLPIQSCSYGSEHLFDGLMIAIHGWTEIDVDISSFDLNNDGTYSGTLKFVFKDNFGLDLADVEKYGWILGFRSWYLLQHNEAYDGKYKPFTTVVEISYPIKGRLESSNETSKHKD